MHSKYINMLVIIYVSITSSNCQSPEEISDNVTIDSNVTTTHFPLPEDMRLLDQCNFNLTKRCERNGYCHYRLDFPLTAMPDVYSDMEVQNNNANFEKIEALLENQAENAKLLSKVSLKLDGIEQRVNKSNERLSEHVENRASLESTSVPLTAVNFEETSTQNERLSAIEVRMKSLEDLIRDKIPRQQNVDTTTEREPVQMQNVVEKIERSQFEIGNRLSNLEEAILSVLRGLDASVSAKIDTISQACNSCPKSKGRDETSEIENIGHESVLPTEEIGENLEETREEGPGMMLCKTCCEKVSFSEYMASRDLSTSFDQEEREDAIGTFNSARYSVEAATGAREIIQVEQRYREESLEYKQEGTVPTQIEETPVNSSTQNSSQLNRNDPDQTGSRENSITTTPSTWIHEITLPQSNTSKEFGEYSGSNPGSAEYDVIATTSTHVTTTSPTIRQRIVTKSDVPYDCAELYARGETKSGVYRIRPHKRGVWRVYCDMETAGGGWTTIQKRVQGNVNFTRSWQEYKNGFGVVDGDHWIGLDKMHHLTASNRSKRLVLRIDIIDWANVRRYAEYQVFRIRSEERRYQLIAKKYSGTAGDALNYGKNYNHHLQYFTTYDRDNDGYDFGNCGRYYQSGWWFNACFAANLNGQFFKGQYKGVQKGIYWGTWYRLSDPLTNSRYAFKYVDMKVRPVNFSKQSRISQR